jgi:hypothetical protein
MWAGLPVAATLTVVFRIELGRGRQHSSAGLDQRACCQPVPCFP